MSARVKPMMEESEYAEKMKRKGLTPDGAALDAPDMSTPLAPPLGYIKQPSITERIRDMVRSEHLRVAAESAGAETFEEADDFDIGDDYDPSSPYEESFEPEPAPVVESTGVPIPPSGGTGEGAEGGDTAPSGADNAPSAGGATPPAPPAPRPSKAPPGPV